MSENILPEFLDPLLDFLYDKLPPPIYSTIATVLEHSYILASSSLSLVQQMASSSSWDLQQILPPLITLLAAYLALVSFYRTTGWMIRTAFAFVKWGFILTTLGTAAGYFLANANVEGGNGLGILGGGIIPTLGGIILNMFSGQGRHAADGGSPRHAPQNSQRQKQRPKAHEPWQAHHEWQYSKNKNDARGEGADVQKIIGDIVGSVEQAFKESGWWEAAKGAFNDFSQNKQQQGSDQGKEGPRKSRRKDGTARSR